MSELIEKIIPLLDGCFIPTKAVKLSKQEVWQLVEMGFAHRTIADVHGGKPVKGLLWIRTPEELVALKEQEA